MSRATDDDGEEPTMARETTEEGVMDGAALIAAERQRQIEAEGWSPEHDDEHAGEELATAAACYALPRTMRKLQGGTAFQRPVPTLWPWEFVWWKPTNDRVRELVKAGALIAAEIDRLQRNVPDDLPASHTAASAREMRQRAAEARETPVADRVYTADDVASILGWFGGDVGRWHAHVEADSDVVNVGAAPLENVPIWVVSAVRRPPYGNQVVGVYDNEDQARRHAGLTYAVARLMLNPPIPAVAR